MEDEKRMRVLVEVEILKQLGKKVRCMSFLCKNEDAEYYLAFGNNNKLLCVVEYFPNGEFDLVYQEVVYGDIRDLYSSCFSFRDDCFFSNLFWNFAKKIGNDVGKMTYITSVNYKQTNIRSYV